jgi:hypothetical protein
MAEETQNPATQVSSGLSSMITGIWSAFATAAGSWRGLIGLALILLFVLIYQGKLPVKSDNAEVLSSVANIRKDIADLKAIVTRQKDPSVANNYPSAIDPPRP